MRVEMIPAKALDECYNDADTVIIDVRRREEYKKGHFKGAISLPFDEEDEMWKHIPPEKKYIVYCDRGGASLMAARYLAEKGYRVATVIGGIYAYRGTNYVDMSKTPT